MVRASVDDKVDPGSILRMVKSNALEIRTGQSNVCRQLDSKSVRP